MQNVFIKSLSALLIVLLAGCGGGGGSGGGNGDSGDGGNNTPAPNNKTIYFENDFVVDPSLKVGADDVAIVNIVTNEAVTQLIPFTIAQAGDYELCLDGAEDILSAAVLDQGIEIANLVPRYPLVCSAVSLAAKNYTLKLSNVPRPVALSFTKTLSPLTFVKPDVPYVRTNQKRQIKSDVTASDWLSELNLIRLQLGLSEYATIDELSTPVSYRQCYNVPVSKKSPAMFRINENKLLVSFKVDFSDGEKRSCTYVEATGNNPVDPTNAGDIGDIDSIIASFVNSGPDSDAAVSSLNYSRPRQADTNVAIGTDVVIGFKGTLDLLTKEEAFTISPAVSGQTSLEGSVLVFNPDGAFAHDTAYTVTLAGLSDADGNPATDIVYSFRTEKDFNLSGEETSLTNAEFCALGVSEYCDQEKYATITGFSVNVKNDTGAGSRYLEVNTTLDKVTNADVVFQYEITKLATVVVPPAGIPLPGASPTTELVEVTISGGFVIEAGKSSDVNYIELHDTDFEKDIYDATVKINAFNVFNSPAEALGVWSTYNGEFFVNAGSVVTNDTNVAEVSGLSFLPGITEHDRKLVIALNSPATEEVNLKIAVDDVFTLIDGNTANKTYLYPALITFAAGEQQIEIDVILDQSHHVAPENYSSVLTPSIVDARNASFTSVVAQNETITIVDPVNKPAAQNIVLNVDDNFTVGGRMSATDPNQLPLTYSIVSQPVNGNVVLVDSSTGIFTYAVDPVQCATTCSSDAFTFKVNNGFIDSTDATVSININRDAVVPVPVDGYLNVVEDNLTAGLLQANTASGVPNNFSLVSQGSKGTIAIVDAQTGSYSYTPNADETGQDSFTYTVGNSFGASAVTATIIVNILPQDDVPVAQDLNVTTDEDTITFGPVPVINPDNDPLTGTIVTPPTLGSAYFVRGVFTYSPGQHQHGSDSFTYKVNDGVSDSNIATVSISITSVNDAPISYSASTLKVTAGSSVSGVMTGRDDDQDAVTYSIVTSPTLGGVVFTNPATGDYTYTANVGVSGGDSFEFKSNDGIADSNIQTGRVIVFSDATTPISNDREYNIDEDEQLNGNMSSYSYSNATRTYQVVTQPQNGGLTYTSNGSFTYIPSVGYSGVDSFTFNATEGGGVSNTSTVTINIVAVEDFPVVEYSEKRIATGESVSDVLVATDGDGDDITYNIVTQPSSGTVSLDSVSGAYNYVSTATIAGSDYFIWTATDTKGNASTAVVFFTVFDSANSVPVASGVTVSDLNGGDVVENDILVATYTYSDVDGDSESSSRIRWLLDGVEISAQTSSYYTVQASDVGHAISFDVLPTAQSGREFGSLVVSSAVNVISPELFLNMDFGIKQLKFSWQDTTGASYYKLLENADGSSGFTQIGIDITTMNIDHEISVHLQDWDNSRYMLQACDSFDVCTDSNELTTYSIDSSNDEKATGYFKASNTDDGDNFGHAVAISADGNTMVVGAPDENSQSTGVGADQYNDVAGAYGAVYVFTKVAGVWSQQEYIKAPVALAPGRFGTSLAISGDGNVLAVGGGLNYEDVNVYQRSADVWSHQVTLNASNTEAGDDFGLALAMSADGKTLVIGAQEEDSASNIINGDETDNSVFSSGAAYVFKEVVGVWTQQAYLKASNAGSGDGFGEKVAISADGLTIAVAALGEDSASTGITGADQSNGDAVNSGAIYVFVDDAGSWSQQAYIKASNTSGSDYFGQSLALSGDGNRLVVGANRESSSSLGINGVQDNDDENQSGAVYSFERSVDTWVQQSYIKSSNAMGANNFGHSLAMSDDGNTLIVGTYSTGYLLHFFNGQWQHDRLINSSNNVEFWVGSNCSINADGSTLVMSNPREQSAATGIGGDQNDKSLSNAGAVYLY